MKPRAFFLPLAVAMSAAILWGAVEGRAHRISGHPRTIDGKLRQAKRQVWHDHQQLRQRVAGWHWLRRDLAYVRRLEQLRQGASLSGTLARAFLCIHSHEGPWDDPNPPYFGGLQMDWGFMSTYGPEYLRAYGTADRWPPSVQILVAIRAHQSGRGFYPWPNTARACGLL